MRNLEAEKIQLQVLGATGNQWHIELFKTKIKGLPDLLGVKAQGAMVFSLFLIVGKK